MENNLNQRKKYIEFIVEKYYSRFSFLHDKPLEEYQQKAVDKYLNSSLTIEEIIKDINVFVENKRRDLENRKKEEKKIKDEDIEILDEEVIEKEEEKTEVNEDNSNTELSMMIEDNKEKKEENNITMTNEKPKVLVKQDTTKTENKGFAALLTVIIAILIVIAMVLVTMISYTLVK